MQRIYETNERPERWVPHKYLLRDSTETGDLPTGKDIPAGSTAYTADLSLMYQYDGTEWVEIGGS